jgi:long-chain fatty acid transport protein
MGKNVKALALFCCLVVPLVLRTREARASGFMIYEHSALSTGMGNARTALWDDASSLYFNPAALTELEGWHLSIGDTLLLPFATYKPLPEDQRTSSTDGENATDAVFTPFYPFHLYVAARVNAWLGLGIGMFNPFGVGSYWPDDWDGRFVAWQTELQTYFFQPAAAVSIARLAHLPKEVSLSVAVGVDYVYGTARIRQKVDLSSIGAGIGMPDAEATLKLDGDAHGLGANYALFVAWKPWFSAGLSVRSNVHMHFRGDASFTGIDPAVSDVLRILNVELPASTRQSSDIELPWNLNAGIAIHVLTQFTFTFDLYVTFWESYDELRFTFDCSTRGTCYEGLNEEAVYPKTWKTAYQIGEGIEYRPIRSLALRVGYAYVTDPTNPDTYDPINPDGNRNLICAGIGYRAPRFFKVDLGYMAAFWKNKKHNDVGAPSLLGPNGYANGTYRVTVHLIALSLGFSFGGPRKGKPATLD